jgi:hypothetical protein
LGFLFVPHFETQISFVQESEKAGLKESAISNSWSGLVTITFS